MNYMNLFKIFGYRFKLTGYRLKISLHLLVTGFTYCFLKYHGVKLYFSLFDYTKHFFDFR